jgi:hypothetical protein
MTFDGMTQVKVGPEFIAIASSPAFALKISSLFQFKDDSLHSSHRNADACGHVAQSLLRLCGQTEQNMPVVRQERPRGYGQRLIPRLSSHM